MDKPALRSEKGGAYMLRTLSLFEKYEINTDGVCPKRRYRWNILHWSKNNFKSTNNTNRDNFVVDLIIFKRRMKWPTNTQHLTTQGLSQFFCSLK